MARLGDPKDLRLVVILLRSLKHWTKEKLSLESGVDKGLLSDYELGKLAPSRRNLERIAVAVGGTYAFAAELIPICRRIRLAYESVLGPAALAAVPDGDGLPELPDTLTQAALSAAAPFLLRLSALPAESGPRAEDRAWAEVAWARLKDLPPAKQREALGWLHGDERMWALVERLCYASATAAADRADRALALAELAGYAAERMPGPEDQRAEAQGFAWGFLANAKRVAGDLPGTREGFRTSDRLWKAGEPGHGLFDGSRLLDLKASLYKHDGRIEEAAALLEQALVGSRSEEARGRILIQQAALHARRGAYERAIEVLEQAEPLLDVKREPRLAFAQLYNRARYLCFLQRFTEAQELVPNVRKLAVDLANELDLIRVLGLEGKARAGLGFYEEAQADFAQARRYFEMEGIAFDYAIASLELALVYLDEGRTAEVAKLADEMWWLFTAQGVHEEALAALRLFCEAARREEAKAGWVRRLLDFLYRAQDDPKLQFEA